MSNSTALVFNFEEEFDDPACQPCFDLPYQRCIRPAFYRTPLFCLHRSRKFADGFMDADVCSFLYFEVLLLLAVGLLCLILFGILVAFIYYLIRLRKDLNQLCITYCNENRRTTPRDLNISSTSRRETIIGAEKLSKIGTGGKLYRSADDLTDIPLTPITPVGPADSSFVNNDYLTSAPSSSKSFPKMAKKMTVGKIAKVLRFS